MKSRLFITFLFIGQTLMAQSFLKAPLFMSFEGGDYCSIAFADIDGDKDQDLLITGRSKSLQKMAKLFINNSVGEYLEINEVPFVGVDRSAVAFADVDGDDDLDLLISGQTSNGTPTTNLYLNNGVGIYALAEGTPFEGVESSSIAFVDIDQDQDLDLFITGRNKTLDRVAKLYVNDGLGSFMEMMDTPFVGVDKGAISFADIDGDKDEDLLITGQTSLGTPISKLYTNNGLGRFTEKINPFEPVEASSVAFADIDQDGDQDVIISGQNEGLSRITRLYFNNSRGDFVEDKEVPFVGVNFGSIALADVDNDSDLDLLITGQSNSLSQVAELYHNNGDGTYTKSTNTLFDGVAASSVMFTDVDGDSDQDILISGRNSLSLQTAELYLNNSIDSPLEDVISSLSADFILYPNPSENGNIHLRYTSEDQESVNITVFDLQGRRLKYVPKSGGVGEQNYSIDVSSFPQGTYLIQLEHGTRRSVQKFSIQ